MPYDFKDEVKRVKDYYNSDPLQQRFSALVTGPSGSGKTFMLRTGRFPVHVDSFDPGGTKCLKKWIDAGHIIADTQWESEDPYDPKRFGEWMAAVDLRLKIGYFDHFGTYALDSASTWGDAVMNYQLEKVGKAGEAPKWNRDYTPQKTFMINYIKKLMKLKCDFIMTGHLEEKEETIGQTKGGEAIKRYFYRFMTTGKATVTIPLQFDELYVIEGEDSSTGVKRKLITESQGKYYARSRLKGDGVLSHVEEPDIKKLLKKVGLDWDDKPRLEVD